MPVGTLYRPPRLNTARIPAASFAAANRGLMVWRIRKFDSRACQLDIESDSILNMRGRDKLRLSPPCGVAGAAMPWPRCGWLELYSLGQGQDRPPEAWPCSVMDPLSRRQPGGIDQYPHRDGCAVRQRARPGVTRIQVRAAFMRSAELRHASQDRSHVGERTRILVGNSNRFGSATGESISVIDAASYKVTGKIKVGAFPRDIVTSPGTHNLRLQFRIELHQCGGPRVPSLTSFRNLSADHHRHLPMLCP